VTKIIVSEENHNQRLDVFLSKTSEISSRSRAQELIDAGKVSINGKPITKSSYKISTGNIVEFELPVLITSKLKAQNIPLDIFYEDDHLIVINKPSGMVVHPAAGHADNTLVNALLFHCKKLSVGFKEERPGVVHRIDKDTSGLLVVAKDDIAHNGLAKQFANKTVHRKYWAICFGKLPRLEDKVSTLIGRAKNERKKFSSKVTQGKTAVTNYKVLATYKNELTLVSLKLETGRTHQIRVHLNDLGNPIVGDWFYCSPKKIKSIESGELREKFEALTRFALHAAELGFEHPITKENLVFTAPPPKELKDILTFCDFLRYL
jgi:23S rRNA pseudouridine1911/1915/1917 synthase